MNPRGRLTITPIVKAQNGFMPNTSRSLILVERPMQRKQKTKHHERKFLIGAMAFDLRTLSNQSDL
jgi:hypothetical protein